MQDTYGPSREDLLHLASLGEVFGGFFHEIAQPLNAIMIAAQVIQLKAQNSSLPEEEKTFLDRRLDIVSSQVQRATQMVESLRLFSSATACYPEEANIEEVLERVLEFMRTQFLKRGIDVALQCGGSLPRIRNDLHVTENIVVQILAYARDSVEAIVQWHEAQGAPYEKVVTINLTEDREASAIHVSWGFGKLPTDAVMIDPKSRVGLVTADLVLQSAGGILETQISGVVARIP